jgi:hypothetical protein
MRNRNAAVVALAGALAFVAGGCGTDESCPEATAVADSFTPPSSCTPSTTTLTLPVQLCEECSHTSPSCTADVLSAPGTLPGEIFLSTQWELCDENRSCSAEACGTPTCTITVTVPGDYDVSFIIGTNPDGSFQTDSFPVTFGSASGVSTCT